MKNPFSEARVDILKVGTLSMSTDWLCMCVYKWSGLGEEKMIEGNIGYAPKEFTTL